MSRDVLKGPIRMSRQGIFSDSARSVLVGLLLTSLLFIHGCSSAPAPLSVEERARLGRMGVMALASTPDLEFQTFAKGWGSGAAKGGAFGLIDGVLDSAGEVLRNQPSGPYAGPAILITSIVVVTVHTVVYGVAGGIEAVPGKTAREIEQELRNSLGNVNLADALAAEIAEVSGPKSEPDDRYRVSHLDSCLSRVLTDCGASSQQGVDTLVAVQVAEAGFRGGHGSTPSVSFYLNIHLQVLSVAGNSEIYTRDFQYLSQERPFAEWFANGSELLRESFSEGIASLAERIVDELFVVTQFPFSSGLWALPGQPEFGSCWFRPIYPELEYTSLWYSMRHFEPGVRIRYTLVDSLEPLLKWETFPRPRDLRPANAAVLNEITDVTYDLKLWEATNDFPTRLVYDISGLPTPQWRPTVPLQAGTKYFWTVRARYKLANQLQTTRWAFSNIPSNVPGDYPQRQPGGSCDLDAIPRTNFFRFVTP